MALEISLEGKVALVTGASSGIGTAIALAMAEAGAGIIAVGRDQERLRGVTGDISARGGQAVAVPADLTTDAAGNQVVAAVLERYGRLDCLVHCAGLFLLGPSEESVELLDRQWATNVRAPFALTVAALPELRRRRGCVLFMSSVAGVVGFPTGSAYCATKGAIEQLVRSLAVEEAPHGVRVNAIAPGNVETPMNAHLMADPGYKAAMIGATPLGRNGQVSDIAPLAVLLVSGHSAFTTGTSILVDGGWSAQ